MQNIIFFLCLLIQAEIWHFSCDSPHCEQYYHRRSQVWHCNPKSQWLCSKKARPLRGNHLAYLVNRCTLHTIMWPLSCFTVQQIHPLIFRKLHTVTLCIESLYWFPHPSSHRLQMRGIGVLTFDRKNPQKIFCDCQITSLHQGEKKVSYTRIPYLYHIIIKACASVSDKRPFFEWPSMGEVFSER